MTQEKFDRIYGPAIDNISSQEDINEQQSRIDKNTADIKAQQQQIALQQQQQDTQHLLVIGGLTIAGVAVAIIAAYLFIKLLRSKNNSQPLK